MNQEMEVLQDQAKQVKKRKDIGKSHDRVALEEYL